MPVVNRIADYAEEMKIWRRHLHQIPELALDLPKTAAFVAERLREFGVDELHEGIATSGMVAIINGQGDQAGEGPTIGLRADMDALPIPEETGVDYDSGHAGNMHACGHDGHTTMLLGAAKYLAETRNFKGRVALIFQPAEEAIGGARIMVEEGIMERFNISEVYALHNAPGLPVGAFATTPGPLMAAVDTFHINIQGVGGHGAMPHETRDPVMAACGMAQAIQTIVSRNHYALDDLVVSVTQIHTGTVDNVIPDTAYINGTVRTFDPRVQEMVMRRMKEIVAGQAASYGVEAELDYEVGYPATINDAAKTGFAATVAGEIAGSENVEAEAGREMGAEDFSYMLQARPGAYLFLGQGDSAGLHHPKYDFNDEIAPIGASFFARLVERAQPMVNASDDG
ncbi:M20 aminoacylase family protein [Phaeobacter inhibens]|uniref:M20 aminoacylase family protein n=1 Tax=Phaeobacter inhibens TaxID=221822 RepID=UPI0021A6B220|nr:M20 aminoacylase family protein [Phaeobacter inhibens]UWR71010.1 amidohydrolase [Phaeobacter inhibens]